MGDAEQGVELVQGYAGAGFFPAFSQRCLFDAFGVFHKTRGQSPVAVARFYGSAAQQDFIFEYGQAAGDDARVLIVHRTALFAYVSESIVIRGDA